MLNIIKREILFFISLFLTLILAMYNPNKIQNYISYIDFPTIRALIGLLLITTALKQTNIFDYFVEKLLKNIKNERSLAFVLIFSSLFLSMLITNDITLFVIVPLTLTFSKFIKNDISKFIIFEAIAVNSGSLLTPIGNPQNIFLFRSWGIDFFNFSHTLFPLFFINMIMIIFFIFIFFPKKALDINLPDTKKQTDKIMFFFSTILFIIFIVSIQLHFVKFVLIFTIFFYLFARKEIFKEFDYFLILTFILMFIDFRVIANLEIIKNFINSFELNSNFTIFNLSIILSQLISNVPATIFMSEFSKNYQFIAYGVNLGGSGLLIGSMANIIALRFYKKSKIYIDFHKYSIPFLIISYLLFYLYLRWW